MFFQSLGITFLQGYGQTEAGAGDQLQPAERRHPARTVGPPVAGCEVRIAEDGEIMVRGENVMHGYWRNHEETARVLRDGWLATGDVGHLDEKGRIVITDRKKDLIVNDKGDNISPQQIEGMLTLQPEIAQAMVTATAGRTWSRWSSPIRRSPAQAGPSSSASSARSTGSTPICR